MQEQEGIFSFTQQILIAWPHTMHQTFVGPGSKRINKFGWDIYPHETFSLVKETDANRMDAPTTLVMNIAVVTTGRARKACDTRICLSLESQKRK